MIWYNETSGLWEKMSTDMDWVTELGVNTDNDVIGGREYEGYMWANVSHFSTYGLSGGIRTETVVSVDSSDDDGPLDSDRDGLFDFVERRMGTDPYDQDTDDDGIIDSKDEYPLVSYGSDEVSDIMASDEKTVTNEDTLADPAGDVPDDSGTSSSFWMLALGIVALLAGIVVLKRKE
jgi:LPXTG-motif cell wall-anchored protein